MHHQLHTKGEIVLAAVEAPPLEPRAILDVAERVETPASRVDVVIDGLVDLVIRRRRTIGPVQSHHTEAVTLEVRIDGGLVDNERP